MKIVLIGSGNVAWNLGKLFLQNQHQIIQVVGTNNKTASQLAYELNTQSINHFTIINKNADLYVIAVNDNSIEEIANELNGINKLVVHTSGAIGIDILRNCSNQYGCLYPLQSLLFGVKEIPEIPFLIQGNSKTITDHIYTFAKSISKNVLISNAEEKLNLHIGAVFVNNFVNHIYTLTFDWCIQNKLNFQLLIPLIKQTANRLTEDSPIHLQTGPAIRNDINTIKEHLNAIKNKPELEQVYKLFTESIRSYK